MMKLSRMLPKSPVIKMTSSKKIDKDKTGEVNEILGNFGKRMDEMSNIRLKMEKDIIEKKKDLKE
jgi:hypothetical protein